MTNKTDIYVYPWALLHPERGFYTVKGEWSHNSAVAMRWTHEGAHNKRLLLSMDKECLVYNLSLKKVK